MSKLLLITLISITLAAVAQSQTTSFTYDFYGDQPTDLTYQGDARFPSDSTFLRLTEAQPNRIGRVLYKDPVQFWIDRGQVDFETTINFIITPNALNNDPADGVAFFIAPVGSTIPSGSGGANFGIFGSDGTSPNLFAVEFDTYVNGAWDPSYPHIGIDIGSKRSSNTTNVGDSIIGRQVNARINYVGATKMLSVHVTAGSDRFEVSYQYDLSRLLTQRVQVGLSAATGELTASHDIVSWYFTATMGNSLTGGTKMSRKHLDGGDIIQMYEGSF